MPAELKNDRLIRALLRQPVDMTPVWMMRQAGRYLPEYRATREKAGDFVTLCQTPDLACEVTLQPLDRYPLDAAILFSDILTIPDAMGLGLKLIESVGPKFDNPISSLADIKKLPMPDPEDELGYVMDAVRLIRNELDGAVPLIGFAGSPWTLATYMIEGGSSRDLGKVKTMLYQEPKSLHLLLDHVAKAVASYLNAQIRAGAQIIQIFDTWGGALSTPAYKEFSLAYMQQILDGLEREYEGNKIPVILFTKGAGLWLEDIAATGCDAVGLDWTQDIGQVRESIGERVALQGNMDPAILKTNPDVIRKEVKTILDGFGKGPGHVFNLGHGITPDIDPENAGAFINAVHDLSK
ncbi:MAG TPA: uroporphyrinogen decarboxylase [Thiotrichaceae bacterium]|jgi:uroporphyrinogen decarboxylase|nr:uroporphyrinogen decarboxylase [Thiotrichaceae bacterium]HIM07379.1 uroporphyrinogen decarboxylase [Gammaproteobacteria bacterium]